MNRDDIIRLAQESGLKSLLGISNWRPDARMDAIEIFAALVSAEKDKEIELLREDFIWMQNVREEEIANAVLAEREQWTQMAFAHLNKVQHDMMPTAVITVVEFLNSAIRAQGDAK